MALKITLKPGEKFVINGAVVVNGDRRTSVLIQNKVSILREKDVMLPDEANTQVKRIYFNVMMMYLDDTDHEKYLEEFSQRVTEFMQAITNQQALAKCVNIVEDVNAGRFYTALMNCKSLLPFEKERLEYVAH
ncbi:MAG: flagellar biosynthesis repressor FlbT [Proteobacteria bacterium]|nr:flagellar biosynthesis repressor FlbT [Pseudomonadota bacterium]